MVRALVLLIAALFASPCIAMQASNGEARRVYRVLIVGNSLVYTNNLPALLRAVGAADGTQVSTETYAAPGGTLAERWDEGNVARALRERSFDVLVLQERGNVLGCLGGPREERDGACNASVRAHRAFASLARERGARVLLFGTWAPDERGQPRLDKGTRDMARQASAQVFDAAAVLRALRKTQPDADPLPDGVHPSVRGSLMLAMALYRDISGRVPPARALRIDAPLLPVASAVAPDRPMEVQPGLAGDGKATVVPVALVEPLLRALP